MAIPQFNYKKPYSYDPVNKSAAEVLFNDVELNNNCFAIEKNIMKFNINCNEKEIIPYDIIKNMIDNKEVIKYLEIKHFNKFGDSLYSVFLKNFRFVKILNFLDFDWNEINNIKDMSVVFKYEKIYTIMSSEEYEKFNRKIKLEKINDL